MAPSQPWCSAMIPRESRTCSTWLSEASAHMNGPSSLQDYSYFNPTLLKNALPWYKCAGLVFGTIPRTFMFLEGNWRWWAVDEAQMKSTERRWHLWGCQQSPWRDIQGIFISIKPSCGIRILPKKDKIWRHGCENTNRIKILGFTSKAAPFTWSWLHVKV